MYTIIPTKKFKEDIEYYEKKKRFKNITNDIGIIIADIIKGNLVGDVIPRITV